MSVAASVVITFDGTALDQIMQGAVTQISSATNSLPSPLNATAYDSFGVALDPQPTIVWESSNPGAVSVSPTDETGSQCNVTRTVQSATDLFSHDSNGVVSDGSQIGGLAMIEATALRPDNSKSGILAQIKVICQATGYGYIKSVIGGLVGPGSSAYNTTFTPPTNLVE